VIENEGRVISGDERFTLTRLVCLLMDKREFGAVKAIAEALFDVATDASVPWDIYKIACEEIADAGLTVSKSDAERGLEFLDSGQNEEAVACLERAVEGHASTYFNLGLAFLRLCNFLAAQGAFLKVVEIKPNDVNCLNFLGQAHDEAGDRAAAELAFLKSLKLNPDYALSYYGLGMILAKWRTRDNEAEACFKRAIVLKPDMGWAYYCVACLKALAGKKRDALTYLRKALERGVHNRKHIARDTDLDSVRNDASFQRLMRKYFSEERGG
jgi:tetratricopeptide (TPR) repeat protein